VLGAALNLGGDGNDVRNDVRIWGGCNDEMSPRGSEYAF
jgi:hypothetical protein